MSGKSPAIGHYEWLDLLRFLAALAVVACHARYFLFASYSSLAPVNHGIVAATFFSLTDLGHEAVIVFFVLSGYLVGGKAIDRMLRGTFSPQGYAIDRITRIWVPLVPALALSVLIEYFALGRRYSLQIWIGNLLGLQNVAVPPLANNVHLWSLAYEIWFYTLTYAVGRLASRKSSDLIGLLLCALSGLVFSRLAVYYLVCWIFGALFYLRPLRARPALGFTFSIALSFLAIAGKKLTEHGPMALAQESTDVMAGCDLLLAVGTGVLCVYLASLAPTKLSAFGPRLASFSYTLYLVHYPILRIFDLRKWQRITCVNTMSFVWFGSAVAMCAFLAWIMYLMFERNTKFVRTLAKWSLASTVPVPMQPAKLPLNTL